MLALVVVAHWLSYPAARGTSVPKPGIKPVSPTLAGGTPGKSQCLEILGHFYFILFFFKSIDFFFIIFLIFLYLAISSCCMQDLCCTMRAL